MDVSDIFKQICVVYSIIVCLYLPCCSDPDPAPILSLIRKWIPGAKLTQIAGSDMTFVLPSASGTCFPEYFKDLESQKDGLGIISYGISDPQLQEVCMHVWNC